MPILRSDELNKLLVARVKDLMRRKPATSKDELAKRAESDRGVIQKSLGLYPFPPRTDLDATSQGEIPGDGYRIEKIVFNSRVGLPVPAHLYLPTRAGSFPAVVLAADAWRDGLSAPWAQAFGIGMALYGMATLIVDPPGTWTETGASGRSAVGDAKDPALSMGAPALGVYVWDLLRSFDLLESRQDIDRDRLGVAGTGVGGYAAVLALALDSRIKAAMLAGSAGSLEDAESFPPEWSALSGIGRVGDFANVIAMRPGLPVALTSASEDPVHHEDGVKKTAEKLREQHKAAKVEPQLRTLNTYGPVSLNRRVRELSYAFFEEHLLARPYRDYLTEPLPMTDSELHPAPAYTRQSDDPEMLVHLGETFTFRDILKKNLEEPYPEEQKETDLVPWGKYGHVDFPKASGTLQLRDRDTGRPDTLVVPFAELDWRAANLDGTGLSLFIAQLLHQALPGAPEGWESTGMTGDALTSLIASVKTLVAGAGSLAEVDRVVAEGAGASMAALHLQSLRPSLVVETSHQFSGWKELADLGEPGAMEPGARYKKWYVGKKSLAVEKPAIET